MGLMNGALGIGRSALLAYQSALQVVGNNISNAGSTTYTRQTAVLNPISGILLPEGYMPGGGVALDGLRRNIDESLEDRIRISLGDQASSSIQQQTLGQIESIVNELSDDDLSTMLTDFFNAFSSLQSTPEDMGTRRIVLNAAESLVGEIQRQRAATLNLQDQVNIDIQSNTENANELLQSIADLNVRITELESSASGGANSLRDQRDAQLRELAELVQIEVREQADGGANVYIGNELVIQGGMNRGLTTTLDVVDGQPKAVVRFADNGSPVTLESGTLAGLVASRDESILGYVQSLDDLAQVLISEVNQVHADGQGLEELGQYSTLTGAFDVLDADAVLNSSGANLASVPQNGSFLITLTDSSTGVRSSHQITVDLDGIGADETLTTLAAKIDAIDGLTATVTADNRLKVTSDSNQTFTFAEDSSGALAALGMNVLFTGHNANDLAVNESIVNNPYLLAAAAGGGAGDGSNAAAIAALGTTALNSLNGLSLTDYYNNIATEVAAKTAAATSSLDAADNILLSLNAQRESVSGVSLDEETISLLKLERAFQGAAQYTSVVNELMDEMLNLL